MFFMTFSAIISGKIYPSLRIEVQRALRVNCLMNVTSWLTASCHLKRFNPPRSGLGVLTRHAGLPWTPVNGFPLVHRFLMVGLRG